MVNQKSALTIKSVALREGGRTLLIHPVGHFMDSAKLMGFETQRKTEGAVRDLKRPNQRKLQGSSSEVQKCIADAVFEDDCYLVYLIDLLNSVLRSLIYLTYSANHLCIHVTFKLFSCT